MELKEIVDTLENRGHIDNQVLVEVAINNAINVIKRLQRREDPTVDFQGWRDKKLTYKDLKDFIAANDSDLNDDTKLVVCVDDGMGYGEINGICTDLFISNSPNSQEIQIWL